MQPGGVDVEGVQGGQQQPAAQVLGDRAERLQAAAEPVVVEQPGGHREQLGHGRLAGPAGHVVERGRCGEPVRDQRGAHLAVGEQRLPAHRRRLVDQVDQVDQPEPTQVVGDQQQRADLAAGAHRRRVEPGERAGPAVQLAGGLQLVESAQCCHNALADLAVHPVALDQLHVLVHLVAAPDSFDPGIHVGTTIPSRYLNPRRCDTCRWHNMTTRRWLTRNAESQASQAKHATQRRHITRSSAENGTSGAPTSLPKPVTTLSTPAGSPPSWRRRASSTVEAEVNSDGFTTTVHPAASAGASFHISRSSGELHGVMIPTTPTGSLRVNVK